MLRKYLLESMTQYELAHKTAQLNAALPIDKGGLGLHSENTARDRAKAMGFDVDTRWLHGSARGGYVDSTDIHGFNHIKIGDRYQQDKTGFFFTDRKDEANYYSSSDLDYYDKGKGQGVVYPVLLKYGNSKSIKSPDTTSENVSHWDNNSTKFNKMLSNNGIDSIVMQDTTKHKMAVVNKPHHIRSIHAAFDPMRQHEPDLLA